MELTIFDQFPPIVKLGSKRSLGGINIRAIEKYVDGLQRNVNPLAADMNVLQRCMLGYSGLHLEPSAPADVM